MAMSRKNYEAIAEVIKHTSGALDPSGEVRESIASDIADVFAYDNPRFDRVRFLQAAGVREDV